MIVLRGATHQTFGARVWRDGWRSSRAQQPRFLRVFIALTIDGRVHEEELTGMKGGRG